MKCFTHRNSDAVAVCRSCGRALCPDCIAEVGLSCACKNRCEADVAKFNAMLTQGDGVPGRIAAAMPLGYDRLIFLLVLGVAFVWFGVHNFSEGVVKRLFNFPSMQSLVHGWSSRLCAGESRSASRLFGQMGRLHRLEMRDHTSLRPSRGHMVKSDPRPSSLWKDARSYRRHVMAGATGEGVLVGGTL